MPSQVALAQKKVARFFKKKKQQLKAKFGGAKKQQRNEQQTQWQAGVTPQGPVQAELGAHKLAKPAHVYDDDGDAHHYDDNGEVHQYDNDAELAAPHLYDDEADEVEHEAKHYNDDGDKQVATGPAKKKYDDALDAAVNHAPQSAPATKAPQHKHAINEPFGQEKGDLLTTPLLAKYKGEDKELKPDMTQKWLGIKTPYTKYAASADEHRASTDNGQLHRADGSVADSSGVEALWSKDKAERLNYAMDSRGEMYLSDPRKEYLADKAAALANGSDSSKRVNHSTMLAGGDAAGAGLARLREGKVESLGDDSGHYAPSLTQTAQVARTLGAKGVMDPARSNIEITDKLVSDKELTISTQELLSYGEGPDDRFAAGIAEFQQTGNKAALARVEAEIRGRHDKKSLMQAELLKKIKPVG